MLCGICFLENRLIFQWVPGAWTASHIEGANCYLCCLALQEMSWVYQRAGRLFLGQGMLGREWYIFVNMFLCSTLSIVTGVETLFPLETNAIPLSSHLKKHPDGEIRVNLKVIVTKWFCKPAPDFILIPLAWRAASCPWTVLGQSLQARGLHIPGQNQSSIAHGETLWCPKLAGQWQSQRVTGGWAETI